jgi:hypothetical protein
MRETLHQILLGVGAIVLGPVDDLPFPAYRITVPPQDGGEALAFDFSRVSGDLPSATRKIMDRTQFERALD